MWKDIAWQGIGQRWEGPRDSVRIEQARGAIRFLEPALPTNLAAAPAGLPLMAHSSELALATTGRMNPEMVARLSEQVRQIGSAWAGEHFCLNSSIETGELGYNFAPLLDDETVAATVRNLRALEAAYGCRVAIEAGPRYYTWGERWDDHGAMREVAEETGCPIIVDVSHHLCSMKNLGRDPRDGLTREVLERTIELHLTGLGRHSTPGYFYDSHATPVPDEAWRLFTWVLERCTSLKAVTLEHSEAVPAEAYQADVARVVELVRERE